MAPRQPKTHEECRLEVCCACGNYPVKKRLGPSGKSLLNQALPDLAIVFDDPKYPLGLCFPCRKALNKLKENDFSDPAEVAKVTEVMMDLPWFDQEEEDFALLDPESRECSCKICAAVKSGSLPNLKPFQNEKVNPFGAKSRKVGRPSNLSVAVVCKKCLGEVEEGVKHKCTPANRRASLFKLAEEDPQGSQMIASNVLKRLDPSPLKGTKRLAQSGGGKPMPVYSGKPPVRRRSKRIDAIATAALQARAGLSVNKRTLVTQITNRESAKASESNRKVFAPNVHDEINEMKKKFSEHFEVTEVMVDGTKNFIAHVKDIAQFVNFIMECRDLLPAYAAKRVSDDDGGNFLKMAVNIIDLLNCDDPERLSGKKDLLQYGSRNSLDSGINGLFLTAIAQEMKESPEAFETIFDLVSLEDLPNYKFANDLKVTNFLTGLNTCSSSCPCAYCDQHKSHFEKKGAQRTIDSILKMYEKYHQQNGNLDYPAECDSVCREPILPGFPESTPILHVIPPPELHLMEGVVNHILAKIRWSYAHFDEFMASLGLDKEKYKKYTLKCNYVGDDCKKVLDHIDQFVERVLWYAAHEVIPHLNFLRAFARVVHSCFGFELQPDYAEQIRLAREAFESLVEATADQTGKCRVRWFYKVHVVLHHVEEFVEEYGPLGPYSEQAGETVHDAWMKVWVRYRALPIPPQERLLRALVEWNFERVMMMVNSNRENFERFTMLLNGNDDDDDDE